MKLTINVYIDPKRIKDHKDTANILRLIACDVEQGAQNGSIRNNKTEDETDRWVLDIQK